MGCKCARRLLKAGGKKAVYFVVTTVKHLLYTIYQRTIAYGDTHTYRWCSGRERSCWRRPPCQR